MNNSKENKFSDHYPNTDPEKWVMAQGKTDFLIPITLIDDMMVIMSEDAAIYVTKDQVMKFFNLVDKE